MPTDPKVNAENPPKPQQHKTAPSGQGQWHIPGIVPQPAIDPLTGKVLVSSEGPQNVNPENQAAPAPGGQPNPTPPPTPGPGVPQQK